ncbi:MAG TPA: queuosine precursor transporter [Anaerolineaceae bacterium]|nr:queuosine precursor transporter [Anaerolineaceae bacterium]
MDRIQQRSYRYFDLVMALFVTVLIVSNIASSAKIVDWGIAILNLPLAFDAGTILFPVSYIFGDVLTEVYGFKRSRRVIWTGFACLALTAGVLWLVRVMPGEATWLEQTGQDAYDAILGGLTSGGIVLASLVAYLAGEFMNSIVLAKMKVATGGKWLWARTIASTLVGEGVDSLVFVGIACLTGVFPWSLFWTLAVTNYLFKTAIEVIMTPVTYWVVNHLKKLEQEDFFDTHTKFKLLGK